MYTILLLFKANLLLEKQLEAEFTSLVCLDWIMITRIHDCVISKGQ